MINVSVLITTLNEAGNLPRCLSALQEFDEIIVIDSGSQDKTIEVVKSFGVRVENFNWNGEYPKKRQYCLGSFEIKHDFIFFVDGDEEVTPALVNEIKHLDFKAAGYFVKGQYIWRSARLRYGLQNNKLVFFNRHKIEFPVVNDLDIEGMGEIEGHYQPILKEQYKDEGLGQLKSPLLHFAYENQADWEQRHKRYAMWEAEMIKREAYPVDPNKIRQTLKTIFQKIPCRGVIAFCHSYIFKLGFLDSWAGFQFSLSRAHYYRLVNNALNASKATETFCEGHKIRSGR